MVNVLVALLVFVGVYAVVEFLLNLVPPLAKLSNVLAVVLGVLAALLYVGVL